MPDPELLMDYGKVSAAGQACHDIATNLAVTVDQTATACTAPARAPGGFQTASAVGQVHAAHVDNFSDYVRGLHGTGDSIQGSVTVVGTADVSSANDAASIRVPGEV